MVAGGLHPSQSPVSVLFPSWQFHPLPPLYPFCSAQFLASSPYTLFFPWPLSPLQFLPLPPVDSTISILASGEGELRHAYPQVPSSSHPALPCAWGSFPKLLTPPQPQTNRASSLSLLKWLINGCSLWEADVLELLA